MRTRKLLSRSIVAATFLALAVRADFVAASPPNRINFQGFAVDPAGAPLQGRHDLALRVWSDPASTAPGALVYAESHAVVLFVDGVFQIAIGGGAPLTAALDPGDFASADRWIELEVGATVLAPRQRLESLAYALQCANADSVAGIAGASLIGGVGVGSGLVGGGTAGDVTVSLAAEGVGAAQIVDGSIGSAEIANDTVTSADIAANTLTGADFAFNSISSALIADGSIFPQDIANEAGVGFTELESPVSLTSGSTLVLSTTISAPSDGLIVASASLTAELEGAFMTVYCSLTLDSSVIDASARLGQGSAWGVPARYPLGLTRGFPVGGPGFYVVAVVCQRSGSGTIQVLDRQLTAVFTPTGY